PTQNGNGSTTHVTKHPIIPTGGLGADVTSGTNGHVPYLGLITDGTNIYAATIANAMGQGILIGMDTSFTKLSSWTANTTLSSALDGEPTIGIDKTLYGANLANQVFAFDAGTGAATPFVTLAGVGMTPLQGTDGHVYLPPRPSPVDAYDGNVPSIAASLLQGSELYREVIRDKLAHARESVLIATSNLKDLQVEHEGRFASVLALFSELAGRGVELRILHAELPSRPFRASFEK